MGLVFYNFVSFTIENGVEGVAFVLVETYEAEA